MKIIEEGTKDSKFDLDIDLNFQVKIDENLLEEFYWIFDDRIQKGKESDRDIFKKILRKFSVIAVGNNCKIEREKNEDN